MNSIAAIVTGAARGIGVAIAERLVRAGLIAFTKSIALENADKGIPRIGRSPVHHRSGVVDQWRQLMP